MKKQVITLKKSDLNRAVVRGLGRAVWEKKQAFPTLGKVHLSAKLKAPRHKKRLEQSDEEL
ncbi:TPA: hypothetical protein DCZ15_01210 [Candidatus Falkowbacteria bacterium]|jgi:hypothetical protein|nr:MAG: hypothetical protein UV95_C0003G0105 [Candidatus Falkowbacteria bacterium GW2011_GWF2_43_32]HBA36475.1 hypothetical protein [Candidatus Falkowbacteria bacterium]